MSVRDDFEREVDFVRGAGGFAPTTADLRWLGEQEAYESFSRSATEAEAHEEWHRNAGHPMDQPGCPWDCCDPPYEEEE